MLYQLIILEKQNNYRDKIEEYLIEQLQYLNISKEFILFLDHTNFEQKYRANFPTYCLYFGYEEYEEYPDILQKLTIDTQPILPIVKDLNNFTDMVPEILKSINGFELPNEKKIPSLVSCILEGLRLLKINRKVFISYKRSDSQEVAIQLYEALERNGFDVFLDTHSVRPGEPFQKELWHRMTDSEIVVLLNSKHFLESNWTKEELSKASSLSIGIVQVIWPDLSLLEEAKISTPIKLNQKNFHNDKKLNKDIVDEIIKSAEELRARTLASRRAMLITEFIKELTAVNIKAVLQADQLITVPYQNNKLDVYIPIIGIPQSLSFDENQKLIKNIQQKKPNKIYLLYDSTYIRKEWLNHLDWLNKYLPVISRELTQISNYIKDYQ